MRYKNFPVMVAALATNIDAEAAVDEAGNVVFAGADYDYDVMGDDDYLEGDIIEGDYLELEGDHDEEIEGYDYDLEGDDYEIEGDEIGRRRRRRRRGSRRNKRRSKRAAKLRARARKIAPPKPAVKKWVNTALTGSLTLAAAGSGSIQIRPQHDFKASDATFTGLAASTITAVRFGDRIVWSQTTGIDISVFAVSGFMRGFLKDHSLRGGLDVTIDVTLPGAGTVTAVLTGQKPAPTSC